METNNLVDLTRLSRRERKSYQAQTGQKILGRNLPYRKDQHGTIQNYYKLREEELKKESELVKIQ